MSNQNKFSPEVRERAVRLVQENRHEYKSLWAASAPIGPKFGCAPFTLVGWVKRAEIDAGRRPGVTNEEQKRIKDLEREVKELRRANEILKTASAFFFPSGAQRPSEVINAYIDRYRDLYGVEPICRALQVAPSNYWKHAARLHNPDLRCQRDKNDEQHMLAISKVWEENYRVYGARKI